MDRIDILKNKLENNKFIVEKFKNKEEVLEYLLLNIKFEDKVAIGGSMTIESVGIFDALESRGTNVYWHWKEKFDRELMKDVNVYLTGTNAVTMDGKLINMDGTGNRVASMIFGHDRVYIVIGKNKIVENYDEAIERIRTIAAPLNGKRLKLDTPCAKVGYCMDCNSPQRMCSAETILHKNPKGTQIYICLVDEDLGL